MKKQLRISLVTTAVLLAASTSCFAHAANYKGENYKGEVPCPTPLMIRDGFYLGAQVGYDSYRTRTSVDFLSLTGDTFSANPVVNPVGWVGGVFAGYGQYFNDIYYLGGEIFVNGSGASQSTNFAFSDPAIPETGTLYTKVSVGTEWGISLLPGVKLNDATLMYVRLGYNRADIKGTGTLVSDGISYSASNSHWSGGFNYGLGIESSFYPNWSARLEYTHTNYNSFNVGTGVSVSPSDNQGMLGLIYHFA